MKAFAVYAGAALIGLAAPFLVLWLAREAPIGSDPRLVAACVVVAVGIVASLISVAMPRHWLALALVISVPLCALGAAMFWALADIGEYFWIWLWVGLGAVAAALAGAFFATRTRRA